MERQAGADTQASYQQTWADRCAYMGHAGNYIYIETWTGFFKNALHPFLTDPAAWAPTP